jgi:hypothetical protein
MSKASFIFSILLFLVIVAGIVSYNLELLPQSVYPVLYSIESAMPFLPTPAPYLEKFQGYWALVLTPDPTQEASVCVLNNETISINNGELTGTLTISGTFVAMSATVAPDGTFTGVLNVSSQQTGTFQGQFVGSVGTGTWQDSALGCQGQLGLTKLEPVIDPVMGHVVSINGDVVVERDGTPEPVAIDESLYAGDVVSVPSGGTAFLAVGPGLSPVTVAGGTNYTVPNTSVF